MMCTRFDCIYHAPLSAANACDYMIIKMDSGDPPPFRRGCPLGRGCTRYTPGDSKPSRRKAINQGKDKIMFIPKLNVEKARKLYEELKTDREIAAALKSSEHEVRQWRIRSRLPKYPDADIFEEEHGRDAAMMYRSGMSDRLIADGTGSTAAIVAMWRRRHNLEAKHGKSDCMELQRLYDRGLNDKEIAEELQGNVKAVKRWRDRNGLPSNYRRRRARNEDR